MPNNIDLNPQFKKALELMEDTNQALFITGRAGTGKSTLLQYFREHTAKDIAVLAPTGVAAVNVKGQTIHSFFRFSTGIHYDGVKKIVEDTEDNLYRGLDMIIIDEVSMVRADLLDCVDKFLRLNRGNQSPFGGIQMVFIGDLYQLPPVIKSSDRKMFKERYQSGYFFSSDVMKKLDVPIIELEKIYRQSDQKFIEILNAIRNNSVEDKHFEQLNQRCNPDFKPKKNELYVTLTARNDRAQDINRAELSKLKTEETEFLAEVSGDFDRSAYPTDEVVELKPGARIMLLNNDARGRWVNGTMGEIMDIDYDDEEDEYFLIVRTQDKRTVHVKRHDWKIYKYHYDKEKKRVYSEPAGTFNQIPVRLAWAITIHKSQGKTFDQVIIDLGRGVFSPGQTYVALSRCTAMNGLVLRQPLAKKHIFMDWNVVRYLTGYHYAKSEEAMSLEDKIEMIEQAIAEGQTISMTYLKANDQKSNRIVKPRQVGEMEFKGKKYPGMEAYCMKRRAMRHFRVDRILEMKVED